MLSTTEEINLYRLLKHCEDTLDKHPIAVWDPSEKRKFATYVKYLVELQSQSDHTDAPYSKRIQHLSEIVSIHTLHVDVEKGMMEAQLVKKKHREALKALEKPDPDWLVQLKQQEPLEDKRKKTLLEQQKEDIPEKQDSELRLRNVARENETSNVEHVLQHHRQLHDELTTDLGRMAQQLKLNSQAFGDTLHKDDAILQEAQKAVEHSLSKMTQERQRLDKHYAKSWSTSFMSMALILFVCVMFVLVFFTIKFLPKA